MAGRSQKLNIRNSVSKLLSSISDKNREVLERRFGIDRDEAETLESIGKSHKITRERVRQIQEYGLKKIMASEERISLLAPAFGKIEAYINKKGGVAKESDVFEALASRDDRAYLTFVLRLMPGLVSGKESDDMHARHALDAGFLKDADALVAKIHKVLEASADPLRFSSLKSLVKDESQNFNKFTSVSPENILALSRRIKQGPFSAYGLAEWSRISPRGVRDKAHLVFESEKRPLHFKEISQFIDKYFVSAADGANKVRQTHPQTVHNELIKDPRFVLIGRGLYALSEWGYEPGTVKDVLVQILKDAGRPMLKEDVLQLISERRFVKPNTIFLNLQNRNYFKKLEDGKYYLA